MGYQLFYSMKKIIRIKFILNNFNKYFKFNNNYFI